MIIAVIYPLPNLTAIKKNRATNPTTIKVSVEIDVRVER